MPDLLIELFSEEIPARMQARAGEDLKKRVTDGLVEAGFTYTGAAGFTTPRRLALTVQGLSAESPTLEEERKGPGADAPDKAIEGFLRATGLTRDQLEERETPKGLVLFARLRKGGRPVADSVAEVLEQVIRTFPWPKSMRWGSGNLRWVRPLHSILCILSDETGAGIVPMTLDGINATDSTEGHRFMAPDRFSVASFEDYEARLKRAFVILNPSERAERIEAEAANLAFAAGMELVEDRGLLSEVAGLVEWPVVLMGQIDGAFLNLPPEVLQTSMKEHQKFFSVRNPKTGRIEHFITVANRETADNGATILAGNRKVLGARLADAKFFWENDLRTARADMSIWTQALENVTFHNKLGSQADRIRRITDLARDLAPVCGADADRAAEAASLAKADLSSEMVYEFPELQGLMGRYYIEAAGRDAAIAAVAKDHYSPLGPSDDVPTAPLSVAVALADKLDMLTGFWSIDEKPTGSRDPFALRRAALGVIRLVLSNDSGLRLNRFVDAQLVRHESEIIDDLPAAKVAGLLREIANRGVFGAAFDAVVEHGVGSLPDALLRLEQKVPDTSADLLSFVHDRLKVFLRDEGIRHDIIDACIAMPGSDDLALLVKRARTLNSGLSTAGGQNLLQGFRRANNILTQAEARDGVEYSFGAEPGFAETDSERALFDALASARPGIAAAMAAQDFAVAMAELATLRGPIDAFFEDVQINSDNDTLRRNRLNLLHQIRSICLQVADLNRIEG